MKPARQVQVSVLADLGSGGSAKVVSWPDGLEEIAMACLWSCGTFADDKRKAEKFTGEDTIALDFDGSLTLAEFKARAEANRHECTVLASKSHQKPKGAQPPADRFRAIFLLARRIVTVAEHKATWKRLAADYPEADRKAKDPSRAWYSSPERRFRVPGEPLEIVTAEEAAQRPASAPPPPPDQAAHDARVRDAALDFARRFAPAVSGQDGHDTLFEFVCTLFREFRPSRQLAEEVAEVYSARCLPPWKQSELDHKLDDGELKGLAETPRGLVLWTPEGVDRWLARRGDFPDIEPYEDRKWNPPDSGLAEAIQDAALGAWAARVGEREKERRAAALVPAEGPHLGDLEGSSRRKPLRMAMFAAGVLWKDEDEKVRVSQIDDFVRAWLQANGYVYSYRKNGFVKPATEETVDLVSQLLQDLFDLGVLYPERLIAGAVDRARAAEERETIARFREHLAHDPTRRGELARFVRALTGAEDLLHLAVIAHFVWQVKRKLFGLKVDHHMMPILTGLRRSGKSEAVRRLLSVIVDLFAEPSGMDVLTDAQQAISFGRYFVLSFDELAKGTKADRDTLKGFMTRPTVEARRLYSSGDSVTKPNRSTLIGTCEQRVADVLGNELGMRRFYEIRCLPKIDWNEINATDYLALWREVDENAEAPVSTNIEEIGRVQDAELRLDAFADWAQEHLEPSPHPVRPESLYSGAADAYVERYRIQGYRTSQLTEKQFRERLKSWANDPARPWHGDGGPLAYRKDPSGNMRVWLRLTGSGFRIVAKPVRKRAEP
jgi:hypothetical protein